MPQATRSTRFSTYVLMWSVLVVLINLLWAAALAGGFDLFDRHFKAKIEYWFSSEDELNEPVDESR